MRSQESARSILEPLWLIAMFRAAAMMGTCQGALGGHAMFLFEFICKLLEDADKLSADRLALGLRVFHALQ